MILKATFEKEIPFGKTEKTENVFVESSFFISLKNSVLLDPGTSAIKLITIVINTVKISKLAYPQGESGRLSCLCPACTMVEYLTHNLKITGSNHGGTERGLKC